MPTQMDGDGVKMGMGMGMGMAGVTSSAVDMGVTPVNGMNGSMLHEVVSSGYREGSWDMMNQGTRSGLYTSEIHGRESRVGGGIFDSMALPDQFMREYYSQVRIHRNCFGFFLTSTGTAGLQ